MNFSIELGIEEDVNAKNLKKLSLSHSKSDTAIEVADY